MNTKVIPSEGVFKYKLIIIVRTDLGMGKGKIAAQVAHAACQIAYYGHGLGLSVEEWMEEGQRKIVLKAPPSEGGARKEFDRIYQLANEANIPCITIADRGLTQIDPGTITCMAIGPSTNEILDPIVKDLKLL